MKLILLSGLILIVVLSGCVSTNAGVTLVVPTLAGDLTRYATETLTPTVTSTPINAPTATLAPTQTPTPRAYSVKSGDTMSVIAFRNGLSLEELKAANPGVNPYTLSVGMTLYIPAPANNASATAQAPTPTAVPLEIGSVNCLGTSTGGEYCFAVVSNGQDFLIGNISAEFRLTNPVNGEVLTKTATFSNSQISAGTSVVLFAYFAPIVFTNSQVSLQLLTASENSGASANAAVLSADTPSVNVAADGLSAVINGQVSVDTGSADASTVWITAAAFDTKGTVVGVRRIELSEGIKAGSSASFEINIYSLRGKIDRVELFTEALP